METELDYEDLPAAGNLSDATGIDIDKVRGQFSLLWAHVSGSLMALVCAGAGFELYLWRGGDPIECASR
jgi:hypothetical protein